MPKVNGKKTAKKTAPAKKTPLDKLMEVPFDPIDVWYQKFLLTMKRGFGENWMDELPDELKPGLLAIHQSATALYYSKKKERDAQGKRKENPGEEGGEESIPSSPDGREA